MDHLCGLKRSKKWLVGPYVNGHGGVINKIQGDDGVTHSQVLWDVAGDNGDHADVDRRIPCRQHESDRIVRSSVGVDNEAPPRHIEYPSDSEAPASAETPEVFGRALRMARYSLWS